MFIFKVILYFNLLLLLHNWLTIITGWWSSLHLSMVTVFSLTKSSIHFVGLSTDPTPDVNGHCGQFSQCLVTSVYILLHYQDLARMFYRWLSENIQLEVLYNNLIIFSLKLIGTTTCFFFSHQTKPRISLHASWSTLVISIVQHIILSSKQDSFGYYVSYGLAILLLANLQSYKISNADTSSALRLTTQN